MGELFTIIVTEAAKNIPAIILAAVAGVSILANIKTVREKWESINKKVDSVVEAVKGVPDALERVKQHDRDIIEVKQQIHDANLLRGQYVSRSELIESLGTTGQKIHARVDAVEKDITRLDERSKLYDR